MINWLGLDLLWLWRCGRCHSAAAACRTQAQDTVGAPADTCFRGSGIGGEGTGGGRTCTTVRQAGFRRHSRLLSATLRAVHGVLCTACVPLLALTNCEKCTPGVHAVLTDRCYMDCLAAPTVCQIAYGIVPSPF